MIDAERFVVRASERGAWLDARRNGVSATEIALAATDSGFREVLHSRAHPTVIVTNEYMVFGTEAEPAIMAYAHRKHGILPSDWLIADEVQPRFLATPDGLSLDHSLIAECKTTGDPWDGAEARLSKIPVKYRRQVQWQLMVTGAERCLFLWMLRLPDNHGWFYMPWMEPRWVWIERDAKMISELVSTASRLLALED